MNDNKKRINNEQELFELFCDPDSIPLFKQKPYYETRRKKVFATDGRILIMMNPSILSESYEEVEKPFIYTVFRDFMEGYFTFESLKKVLASFEMEEERVIIEKGGECEECEGSGEVEWEYTDLDGEIHFHDNDCPICDGKGEIEGVFENTGFMMPTEDSTVRIGKSFFRGIEAQKLFWTMEYFKVDKAEFSESEKSVSVALDNGVQIAISVKPYGTYQDFVTLETT